MPSTSSNQHALRQNLEEEQRVLSRNLGLDRAVTGGLNGEFPSRTEDIIALDQAKSGQRTATASETLVELTRDLRTLTVVLIGTSVVLAILTGILIWRSY
jgi:hypothetical protein